MVKLVASSVNHVDIWARTGALGTDRPFPKILGADGAGLVEETGGPAEGLAAGTRVLIYPLLTCGSCEYCLSGRENLCQNLKMLGIQCDGTYAEYVAVPQRNLVTIPDVLDFTTASTLGIAYLTAWTALVRAAKVEPGEAVLVPAATGGFGTAAISIARALGADVVATTGSKEKVVKLRSVGVKAVVDVTSEDMVSSVLSATDGRGVDVVLDSVGSATLAASLKCVRRGGRLVTLGATSGREVTLDVRGIYAKGITIYGVYVGTRDDLTHVIEWVAEGKIRPVVDSVYTLEEAAEAHSRLDGRLAFGKIVLRP